MVPSVHSGCWPFSAGSLLHGRCSVVPSVFVVPSAFVGFRRCHSARNFCVLARRFSSALGVSAARVFFFAASVLSFCLLSVGFLPAFCRLSCSAGVSVILFRCLFFRRRLSRRFWYRRGSCSGFSCFGKRMSVLELEFQSALCRRCNCSSSCFGASWPAGFLSSGFLSASVGVPSAFR